MLHHQLLRANCSHTLFQSQPISCKAFNLISPIGAHLVHFVADMSTLSLTADRTGPIYGQLLCMRTENARNSTSLPMVTNLRSQAMIYDVPYAV